MLKAYVSPSEKEPLIEMEFKHKKASSLCNKIRDCPNITFDAEVIDYFPFFVQPFHINEEDTLIRYWQM